MQKIPLNHGKYALVDDQHYPQLSSQKWYCHKGYAVRTQRVDGRKKMVYMHRVIMNPPKGLVVDHINGDKLDNRSTNLRVCTRADNVRNMHYTQTRKKAQTHSPFKGVYWDKNMKKWTAQIRFNKKQIHLGYFSNELDAAKAYDKAAQDYFGDYAWLNFAPKGDVTCSNTKKNLKSYCPTTSGNLAEVQTI